MSSNTFDYIYPIIVPSNVDVEDAFSSTTTANYTPASPDYSPASPGNTSPNPSDDLSNDESPIPLPQAPIAPSTVVPPSLMFDPQDFFLPGKTLPSKKRACSRSSFSTSTLPQFNKKLRNNNQIRHDDEIVLARVRVSTLEMIIEDIQVCHQSDMKNLLAPAMTQATIRKLVADSVATALEAQAATMANSDNTNRNTR
ncbi:hypothetical protein Tco_1437743 [Tanacetum coccineum]